MWVCLLTQFPRDKTTHKWVCLLTQFPKDKTTQNTYTVSTENGKLLVGLQAESHA